MAVSQSLGVRIPGDLLALIDGYQQTSGLVSRSEAIIDLIRNGLYQKSGSWSGGRPKKGARAGRWGHVTSRKIAGILGGTELSKTANEFDINGQRMTIRCARPRTSSVGLTNTMAQRIDGIIAAFQHSDGHFTLYRIAPDDWDRHCRKVTENHQNHGRVTLLARSICRQIGQNMGEISLADVVEDH